MFVSNSPYRWLIRVKAKEIIIEAFGIPGAQLIRFFAPLPDEPAVSFLCFWERSLSTLPDALRLM